jgi:hypothetical protein
MPPTQELREFVLADSRGELHRWRSIAEQIRLLCGAIASPAARYNPLAPKPPRTPDHAPHKCRALQFKPGDDQ